jgi:hypothetical protein
MTVSGFDTETQIRLTPRPQWSYGGAALGVHMAPSRKRRKGGWKSGDAGGGRPLLIDKDEHAHVVEEVAPHEFKTIQLPDAPAATPRLKRTPATKRRKKR